MVSFMRHISCVGLMSLVSLLFLIGNGSLRLNSSTMIPLQSVSHNDATLLRAIGNSSVHWHIKPIKPLHEGKVVYLTSFSDADDAVVYKRIFTAPCGDGMLVFNVGPAPQYEPYYYDLYEDAYAYSDNGGLCVLYPSYRGIQTSPYPLWTARDKTEQTVKLGDVPNKISMRVAVPPGTKPYNHSDVKYKGGDFLIIRPGKFYNPTYYKHLKSEINSWPATVQEEEVVSRLSALVATL